MHVRFGQRTRVALISLLLLCAGAMRPSVAQAAITIFTTNHSCSGPAFNPGDLIRVFFQVDMTTLTSMTLQNPTGSPPAPIFTNFTAQAGVVYEVDGVASSVTGPRRLTLTANINVTTTMMTCDYSVSGISGGPPVPNVTIDGLRVNGNDGVNAMCGAGVFGGSQVCVIFHTDQDGTATISVTKNMVTTIVASGFVTTGGLWAACVTAGFDSGPRTFNVTVTNGSGTSVAQHCDYHVPPP